MTEETREQCLERLLRWADQNLNYTDGGTLYTTCTGCAYDDHNSEHQPGCAAVAWEAEVREVLGPFRPEGD